MKRLAPLGALLFLALPAFAMPVTAEVPLPAAQEAVAGAAVVLPSTARILLPPGLYPGDPLLARVESPVPLPEGTADLYGPEGKRLATARLFRYPAPADRFQYGVLFALPFEAVPGEYRVLVHVAPGVFPPGTESPFLQEGLSVFARRFANEDIGLDEANTAIRTLPDPRKDAEARTLYEILGRSDADAIYLGGSLLLPVDQVMPRSAGFGDMRRYLYSTGGIESSRHMGVDFAVPKGTAVRATARGRVVFAGPRIVTGLTLILEHLPGLYSIYMHLSELERPVGAVVEGGEVIARSGSTGLSTGPHLHWELRVGVQAVNPDCWVAPLPGLSVDLASGGE